jgi:hypothetical protein
MGLSIHYCGKLSLVKMLPLLVEEVKDICEDFKWPTTVFENEFPGSFERKSGHQNIYGICFSPPKSEPVSFCFLSDGTLVGISSWVIYMNDKMKDDTILSSGVSVKTQYAGSSIHKTIIHLLDYLSKKYFRDFNLIDEGQYWETRDEVLLNKNFELLTDLINSVGNMLETTPLHPQESFEKYFERILKRIRNKDK